MCMWPASSSSVIAKLINIVAMWYGVHVIVQGVEVRYKILVKQSVHNVG